jgi:glycosyltransferase involved in cell wall biosynthesis
MKKVCHIISAFNRYDTRIFWKQSRSLANSGFFVYLLTNDNLPNEVKDNVEIISCNTKYKNKIQRILYAKSTFLKKALEIDADIYQIHDPELIPLGLNLKKFNKIVFYDAHEDFPRQILEKEWIPKIIRKPLSVISEWYFKNNLYKFDEILSVTPHIVDRLRTMSDSVTQVTNYPIIENITNFQLPDYSNRETILCYAGTIYDTSNQKYILDAISNIESVKYHMAGVIDKDYLLGLQKHSAWNKVKTLGILSKNEILKFYEKAVIGIVIYDYLPNLGYKRGTLGSNKLFEYMAAGLPLICTDYDLWKEIIGKYECGICVQPNNPSEIETAIRFLIENKEKAYQMGQNGKNAVAQQYNWNTQEKIYIDLYLKYLE